jgi:hypothetical protein
MNIWIPISILIILLLCMGYFKMRKTNENYEVKNDNNDKNETCSGSGSSCSSENNLLPILDPEFNMRECAKQMILLEDHLNNPRKRCNQCIKKHLLSIEALAEEAVTLDKSGKLQEECSQLAEDIRDCEKSFINNNDMNIIAQKIRDIRKPIMIKYFDKFN